MITGVTSLDGRIDKVTAGVNSLYGRIDMVKDGVTKAIAEAHADNEQRFYQAARMLPPGFAGYADATLGVAEPDEDEVATTKQEAGAATVLQGSEPDEDEVAKTKQEAGSPGFRSNVCLTETMYVKAFGIQNPKIK